MYFIFDMMSVSVCEARRLHACGSMCGIRNMSGATYVGERNYTILRFHTFYFFQMLFELFYI